MQAEVRSLRKQVRLLSATQQAALLTPRSSVAGDYDVGGDPLAPLQMTSPGAAAGDEWEQTGRGGGVRGWD